VLVGAGSEIGRACARLLAREGAAVLVVDPDLALAENVCDALRADGGDAHAVAGAFADEAAAAAVAARVEELWSRVDVYVDVHAAMDHWQLEDDALERWESVLRTNVLGPVAYTRALRPLLERSEAASIVYLGSIDGLFGNPHVPAYSVSKGSLIPLTHVMASDLAPRIRVNCIAAAAIVQTHPSAPAVDRPMADVDDVLAQTPLRRVATPEDIARVALFFASDDSAYVTGEILRVDGGRAAATPGTARRRADG
jgi:3-oxoacyl-[acyl-carrier protein] reductase